MLNGKPVVKRTEFLETHKSIFNKPFKDLLSLKNSSYPTKATGYDT